MSETLVPHFSNHSGHLVIDIGVRQFVCLGALPPFDHPHVFLDMGTQFSKTCPYCSTLFRYNEGMAIKETMPPGCFYDASSST